MRFTRVTPEGLGQLKDAVLGDLEGLGAGMRAVASSIQVPDRGTIDLLAADERGRLALVLCAIEAGHDAIGRAVSQWEWAASSLGVIRALAPGLGLDLSIEPRLLLVAATAPVEARRLAGFIARPRIELFEATMVASGEHRGVLIEPAESMPPPPAGDTRGIDPLLGALPAGEARSLTRRVLEEIRHNPVDGLSLEPAGFDGGVAVSFHGRLVALVIALGDAVRTVLVDEARTLKIDGDAGCRAAAAWMTKAARDGGGARGLASALTPEEVAEFERISEVARAREGGPVVPGPEAAGRDATRSRFVEN